MGRYSRVWMDITYTVHKNDTEQSFFNDKASALALLEAWRNERDPLENAVPKADKAAVVAGGVKEDVEVKKYPWEDDIDGD